MGLSNLIINEASGLQKRFNNVPGLTNWLYFPATLYFRLLSLLYLNRSFSVQNTRSNNNPGNTRMHMSLSQHKYQNSGEAALITELKILGRNAKGIGVVWALNQCTLFPNPSSTE